MKTIESFISFEPSSFCMAKDSELVKEVEGFLKENNINILEMTYDRSINFNGKPIFEVLTGNRDSLEKLATNMKSPLKKDYDERSRYEVLDIKRHDYNIHVYSRKKF